MGVIAFALRRLRAAPRRWLPGAVGVAIAIGGFVIALTGPSLAGDVALRNEVRARPIESRTVSLVSLDTGAATDMRLDASVRSRMREQGLGEVLRETALRQIANADGTVYRLAGVDDLASGVAVISGRLPTTCTADHCEAVVWAREAITPTFTPDPALHLEIVGTVQRTDERILSGSFAPRDGELVVFVNGASAQDAIKALELFQRSTGWIAELKPEQLTVDGIPSLLRGFADLARPDFNARFSVTAPDDELQEIASRVRVSTNRLALPVGQAATILGGFAMLTALAIRQWHLRGRRVLRLRCASVRDERIFSAVESGVIVGVSAIVGVVLGAIALGVIASATSVPIGNVLRRAPGHGHLLTLAGLIVAFWLAVMATLRASFEHARRVRRILPTDVLGVAALGVWVLAASRSASSAASLSTGADPLLSLTPAFASIAVGCLMVRLLPTGHALGRRLAPRRMWPLRLALSSRTSGGARPVATAAFLASALTLATFALGYRSTLQTGSRDQAAFTVPFDVSLNEGAKLVRPQDVAPSAGWPTGVTATDVLRQGAAVRRSGTAGETVEILGLDPASLASLRGWRADFGPRPMAASLAITTAAPNGVALPPQASCLTLITTETPPNLGVAFVLERANGTWHEIEAVSDAAGIQWTIPLDAADGNVSLHGFRVGESGLSEVHTQHNIGEGNSTAVAAFALDVRLLGVVADATALPADWSTLRGSQGTVTPESAAARIQLVAQGSQDIVLFGGSVTVPLPAIVDPLTASSAVNGIVTVEAARDGVFEVRVAGVAGAFPSVGERFVIVDGAALSLTLNRLQPGAGTPTEVWLAADGIEAAQRLDRQVAGPAFAALAVTTRHNIAQQLAGDTLGRTVVLAFLWSSLAAALLGALAVIYVAAADCSDERPLLRNLVADGARPRQLVALLVWRSVALVAVALPIGLLGGGVLLHAIRGLVAVSATGTRPVPALRIVLDPVQIIGIVAAVAALSIGGAWWVARATRRIRRYEALVPQT
jgi:hypothetical protein